MFEFIKLLGGAKNVFSKIGITIVIILISLFIDYFTSFPSLNFEQNRYLTIEKMNVVAKDTTIPIDVRNAARVRMGDLSRRKSFRELYLQFSSDFGNTIGKISQIIPSKGKPAAWLLKILCWIIYILLSSCHFLWVYIRAIRSFKELTIIPQKNKKDILQLAIIIVPTVLILPLLVITLFDINTHIALTCFLCQVGFMLIYYLMTFLPFIIHNLTLTEED